MYALDSLINTKDPSSLNKKTIKLSIISGKPSYYITFVYKNEIFGWHEIIFIKNDLMRNTIALIKIVLAVVGYALVMVWLTLFDLKKSFRKID